MLKQADAAHLVTDGAVWDADGICIGIGRKVAQFPGINVAIGFTGFGGHAEWIEEAVASAGLTTTGELLRGLPRLLRDEVARHGSTASGDGLKLHVITYDAGLGAHCWLISSDAAGMPPDYQPYTIVRGLRAWVDIGDPSAILGRAVTVNDAVSFDVVRDGAAIAQAARLTPWDGPHGPVYAVGGYAELTTVGPQGLQVRRLCDWPEDRLGERTHPFRHAA